MTQTANLFGDIFLPNTLVRETENLLKYWFPLYLQQMEERLELKSGTLLVPNNYTSRNQFTSLPGEELPKCVILVPGVIGTPQKSGAGIYRATWRLGIGVAVASRTEQEAIDTAYMYGAVVRAIVEHHTSINGVSSRTEWVDESYDDLPVGDELNKFRSASVWFAVDVDNVVSKDQGPKYPANVYGTVEEVKVEIDKL